MGDSVHQKKPWSNLISVFLSTQRRHHAGTTYLATITEQNNTKWFKVCKSVHHRTIQINHQPGATIFQFIILAFIYSSTCFGLSPDHHQELNYCSSSLWFYIRIVVIVVLCSWSGRSILMMESSCWSKKLLSIYQITRCHKPHYHSYNYKTNITKFQIKVVAFRKDDISTFGTNFGCRKIIRTCSCGLLIFWNVKCLLKVHSQKRCFSFEHTVEAQETRFFFVCSERWEPLKLLDTP
jgi:hypothetical protein